MNHMKRQLFNIGAGASLILLGLTVASCLGVFPPAGRSWWNDRIPISKLYLISFFEGHLSFETITLSKMVLSPGASSVRVPVHGFDFAGFHHEGWINQIIDSNQVVTSASYHDGYWVSPIWLIMLFSILPLVWIIGWRRDRSKIRPGHCRTCGYDLRATPDRCPECGTVAALNTSSKTPA